MEAEGCTFQKNEQYGVRAVDDAEVVVRGCHSTDNGMHGFAAKRTATLTASDGRVRDNMRSDFEVETEGRLDMQRVEVGGIMTTRLLGSKSKLMGRLRGLIR